MRHKPSVKIAVATHKPYQMPTDSMYIPLHVGAEGKKDKTGSELDFGYQKDNSGIDNISELNSSFCELTGLYWVWKNIDADYIGLVHYRRHFSMNGKGGKFNKVLTYRELAPYLGTVKVFVPLKQKYYIETLYSHYAHTHYASHLVETRSIIGEKYPRYLRAYDKVIKRRSGYMFNMMIMQQELLNEYCNWLFDILFELKKEIHMPELSAFQARFFGRVSEILFNVWLEYQIETGAVKRNEVKEIRCIYMEKIDWFKKIKAFLSAKYLGKKYEGSF